MMLASSAQILSFLTSACLLSCMPFDTHGSLLIMSHVAMEQGRCSQARRKRALICTRVVYRLHCPLKSRVGNRQIKATYTGCPLCNSRSCSQ